MHAESIGFGRSPLVATAYMLVAGVLLGCSALATRESAAPVAADADEPEEFDAEPAPA